MLAHAAKLMFAGGAEFAGACFCVHVRSPNLAHWYFGATDENGNSYLNFASGRVVCGVSVTASNAKHRLLGIGFGDNFERKERERELNLLLISIEGSKHFTSKVTLIPSNGSSGDSAVGVKR